MTEKVEISVFPQWASLIKRVKAEVDRTIENNRQDGVAIVSATMAFTAQGEPLAWVVERGKRVEPSSGARDLLLYLSQLDNNKVDTN